MIELLVALGAMVSRARELGQRQVVVPRDVLHDLFFRRLWAEKRVGVYEWPEELDEDLDALISLGILRSEDDKVVIDMEEFERRVELIAPWSLRWIRGIFLFEDRSYQDHVMSVIWRTAAEHYHPSA